MKTLKRGKETENMLVVAILLPTEIKEKLVGRIVDCSTCGFRGELEAEEDYRTHDDHQYETVFVICTNCKKHIKVDVHKSRRKLVA